MVIPAGVTQLLLEMMPWIVVNGDAWPNVCPLFSYISYTRACGAIRVSGISETIFGLVASTILFYVFVCGWT